MAADALLRSCTECHQEDYGPRDVKDIGGGQTAIRHLACCAELGCDSCAGQVDGGTRLDISTLKKD